MEPQNTDYPERDTLREHLARGSNFLIGKFYSYRKIQMFYIVVPNYFGNIGLEKKVFKNKELEELLRRCYSIDLEVRPLEFESCLAGDPE